MAEFKIEFQGVCTHLFPQHKKAGMNPFALKAGDGSAVSHRVVIPNSKLIPDHIDPTRCVPPHIPKLIVPAEVAGAALRQVMMARSDNTYELLLDDVAISFDGVLADKPPSDPWLDLQKLPHVWEKAKLRNPLLHRSVRVAWDDHASAYVDFTTGVTFSLRDAETNPIVTATVKTNDQPSIVFRVRNGQIPKKYPLIPGKDPTKPPLLVVSNLPVAECGNSDYLLNYLITTVSVCEDAPIWQPPAKTGQGLGPEVYCSSSGYP